MTDAQQELFPVDPVRHIVVREAPGRCSETVHTTTELTKWLASHPGGYVVYDALEDHDGDDYRPGHHDEDLARGRDHTIRTVQPVPDPKGLFS